MTSILRVLTVAALLLMASPAAAFCGFYVSGADGKLFNDATMVVMLRDGQRTVLSMQNAYEGPPEAFALVVPVPVVLSEETVKTLPSSLFDRVDSLAAPRLVEYFEEDPCEVYADDADNKEGGTGTRAKGEEGSMGAPRVVVEAEFTVGEYDIVILSANESTALDGWLREGGYQIPEGAEPVLRPYVEAGSKFFVAKVDPSKVRFVSGRAVLSPLRFHYDTDRFDLPIRLGLINAGAKQDLIVHILAKQRYEAANYDNVFIPTNIRVAPSVRDDFGPFYAALFDATIERSPKTVVTEYAWSAASCDPCPAQPLNEQEVALLGGDTLQSFHPRDAVLTRLHARYDASSLGEDLVFRAAEPVVGGGGFWDPGAMSVTAERSEHNAFQGRYIILNHWRGPIRCASPQYGDWSGTPMDGGRPPQAAKDLATATRGQVKLEPLLRSDVPQLELVAKDVGNEQPKSRMGLGFLLGIALGLLGVGFAALRRRRR